MAHSGGRGHRRISTTRHQPIIPVCYLATFGQMRDGSKMPPCDRPLAKVHLIKRTVLRDAGAPQWADAVWVWGCGGVMGNTGHHGMLDHGQRPLVLPRSAIPAELEAFAERYGLVWWLDKEYGERTVIAV